VRQEKANPRKRQSGPCTGNILSICLNAPTPEKASIESVGGIEGLYDLLKNGTEAEKEKFIDLAQGFLKGPKLAALVRVLCLRKMYISRFNSVNMPFDLYTFKGKVEERRWSTVERQPTSLTTKTVARLRLGTQKLDNIRTVKNIDGTLNRSGSITHCWRLISVTGQKTRKD